MFSDVDFHLLTYFLRQWFLVRLRDYSLGHKVFRDLLRQTGNCRTKAPIERKFKEIPGDEGENLIIVLRMMHKSPRFLSSRKNTRNQNLTFGKNAINIQLL